MSEGTAELDHRHLWHPFTQQQGWVEEEPRGDRASRGDRPDRRRRQPLHRRHLVAVVQRPRPPAPGDRRGDPRAARPGRPLDDARAHPRPGRRARGPAGRDRAARPESRLLLGLGLDRDRDRAQDGLPVLASAGRPARATHLVHRARRRLPRGHDRSRLGRRDRPLPRRLRAAAVRQALRPRRECGGARQPSSSATARRSRR